MLKIPLPVTSHILHLHIFPEQLHPVTLLKYAVGRIPRPARLSVFSRPGEEQKCSRALAAVAQIPCISRHLHFITVRRINFRNIDHPLRHIVIRIPCLNLIYRIRCIKLPRLINRYTHPRPGIARRSHDRFLLICVILIVQYKCRLRLYNNTKETV